MDSELSYEKPADRANRVAAYLKHINNGTTAGWICKQLDLSAEVVAAALRSLKVSRGDWTICPINQTRCKKIIYKG